MTSNTSTSLKLVPAEKAPQAAKPPQSAASPSPTQSSTLGWAAAKFGACLNGLACPAVGTLIITSAFLVLRYKNKTKPKPKPEPKQAIRPITRSMSLALMHGGEKAIERLKEFHRVSIEEAKHKEALEDIRKKLDVERINFVDLYAKIGIFEMTGEEDEVIKLLEGALEKAKKVAKDHKINEQTHTTHELKLLLVEMLIYKGKYQQALNYLAGDDVSSTADARVPLYKAVIYSLINQPENAKTHLDEYIDIRNGFHGSKFYKDAPLHLQVSDFDEFVGLVKNIQTEIQNAHPSQTILNQQVQQTAKANQKDSVGNPESNKANQGESTLKDSGAISNVAPETAGETTESTSQGEAKEESNKGQ